MQYALSASRILTMTDEKILKDHSLVIKNSRIVDIKPREVVLKKYANIKETYLENRLLMPSLLNMHNHLAMVLFRGMADDLDLSDWLQNNIWQAEAKWVSEDFVREGTKVAIAEMMLSGTSFCSDMYFFPEIVAEVAKSIGFRMQIAAPIIDFPNAWSQSANEAIEKIDALYKKYEKDEFISIALGPHSPYTLSDKSFLLIKNYMKKNPKIKLHIHLHETAEEVENSLKEFGKRPIKRLADLKILSSRVQAVHLTQVNDEDLAILLENKVNVIHCAKSNLKLASGFSPVEKMRKAGLKIALGTDSAASNNSLNMFSELQSASLLAKGVAKDAKALPAFNALEAVTKNASEILGLKDKLGELKIGAFADVCAIKLDLIENLPSFSHISNLVYGTNGTKVEYVYINGELKVKSGKLCDLSQEDLIAIIKKWQKLISAE